MEKDKTVSKLSVRKARKNRQKKQTNYSKV